MRRSGLTTGLWIAGLYAGAAALTAAAFFTFIIPEYRGTSFYHVLSSSLVAELLFAAYLCHLLITRPVPGGPSQAVRVRIMVLATVGLLAILASGAAAVAPAWADTFFSDKILLWQAIFVLLLFAGAYLLGRQDIAIQEDEAEPQRQRVQIQSYAMGIDPLLTAVRTLAGRRPAAAVELEKLAKRLDTLKTKLLANSPPTARDADRVAPPTKTEWLVERLRDVHEHVHRLTETGDAQFPDQLSKTHEVVDAAVAALRHRERALSF